SASGLAVDTAQKPQARVQRSPAIMNVAVPFSQHSQWFGHFALSQTVCSFSSSSRLRVRAKLSDVGSLMRSQSGRCGRGFKLISTVSIENILTRISRIYTNLFPFAGICAIRVKLVSFLV